MATRVIAGLGALLLGVGIAAAAVLGPLGIEMIEFRTSRHLENQFVGGEVVSLLLVAPLAVVSGVLWLARRPLAPALTLGPSLYAVYTYTTVVVGQEYTRYSGNVERFFPLYAGLVGVAAALAAIAWWHLAETRPVMPGNGLRLTLAAVFLLLSAFFAVTWTGQIRQALGWRPPVEYLESPTLFWTIKLFDLAFVIPLMIATAIGLIGNWRWAMVSAAGLATFSTCLVLSVAGMAVAMFWRNDPAADLTLLAIVAPVGLSLAVLSVLLLRAYRRQLPPPGISASNPAPASGIATRTPGL